MAAATEKPREAGSPRGAASSGLDTMLTDATRGPLRRLVPGRAAVKFAGRLATRPDAVVTRGAQLAAELAKVGIGRSELAPKKGDRFRCQACGMEIQVTADCRCQEGEHVHFHCCGQELQKA